MQATACPQFSPPRYSQELGRAIRRSYSRVPELQVLHGYPHSSLLGTRDFPTPAATLNFLCRWKRPFSPYVDVMQTAYVDAPAKEGKDGGRREDSDRSPEPTHCYRAIGSEQMEAPLLLALI